MGAIRRSFTDLNSDNFRDLFTTMIRPHLEYPAAVWSPHMKKRHSTDRKCAAKGHQTTAKNFKATLQ